METVLVIAPYAVGALGAVALLLTAISKVTKNKVDDKIAEELTKVAEQASKVVPPLKK